MKIKRFYKLKKTCYNTFDRFKWAEIPTFIIGKGEGNVGKN